MRHTYENIVRVELLTLGLSPLVGLIALIQASFLLVVLAILFMIISLICDALTHRYTAHQKVQELKQIFRAGVLLFLMVVLIFI